MSTEGNQFKLDPKSRISLYVQLADALRNKITSGAWPVGYQLPRYEVLAEQYQVARITVRQAVNVLVQENVLVSNRGRGTFVCEVPGAAPGHLRTPISGLSPRAGGFSIVVHEVVRDAVLPPELVASGSFYDSYVEVIKTHVREGKPIGVYNMFVASHLYARFPDGAAASELLLQLALQYAEEDVDHSYQTISIETADVVLARKLDCPYGAPVAKLVRKLMATDSRVLTAGISYYPGDVFLMDIVIPKDVLIAHRPAAVLAPR
ncbi:GntR family transcriptional regulator [Pigmentiphaga sp.]|uniref:GntR family transcriptional regulator n=1 Tax=Pigmentiphaga sp. TaxID=1977564 RepID=UPI00128B8ABD|nr:GntR family transcriptional regulator [Pigmentiphaga sp.]MPS28190.1 GntR family transcriptional regulator [Alcaligenaceae bacterium SAGV5]MPS28405.1 GntR family transcriptional regulator [Alcaligenaceae bacterium SAGV5]MPS51388.1 GntR family transcriptional regulator [Alcaligenaceae bacterium SAGV3]MPT55956.1 GntR family transcriptional regulator [Alcaligenaceae bacterium]